MADAGQDDWVGHDRLPTAERLDAEALIIDVDGFEGPLDLLLTLSRTQKVDLRKISVLQLAEQYLQFVRRAAATRCRRVTAVHRDEALDGSGVELRLLRGPLVGLRDLLLQRGGGRGSDRPISTEARSG